MDAQLQKMLDFFRDAGANDVEHSGKTYLAHASGVYRDLKKWGCDEDLCNAGLFHSIYGTMAFQGFTLPLERRGELRALIGERAERLAYRFCAMDRPAFDQTVFQTEGPYLYHDRFTDEVTELPDQEVEDLCTLQVCDWVEQIERLGWWDHRRAAFEQMARRLGGVAWANYERVFANAPAAEQGAEAR
jgi:hypothetical protein